MNVSAYQIMQYYVITVFRNNLKVKINDLQSKVFT